MSSGVCNSNHSILIVLISLALAAVQGCDIYRVNGDSMSPTFEDGNLIVGLRIRQALSRLICGGRQLSCIVQFWSMCMAQRMRKKRSCW